MTESPHLVPELPEHGLGGQAPIALRVTGLVAHALQLDTFALASLPAHELIEDFSCEAGWVAPHQVWRGVLVGDILDTAGLSPAARYVEFAAEDFQCSLPLPEARAAIVALELNGQPLAAIHGGPRRLVASGAACFTSIKWLDRMSVGCAAGLDSAQYIARARLSRETET